MDKFVLIAIVKNEAPYLLEWLAFYRSIGVQHFVIFNNESDDETGEILNFCSGFIDLEVVDWRTEANQSPQLTAYKHFLENYREKFEFAAFFDSDEFLVPANGTNFQDFLRDIPEHIGAIAFNQRVFGSSGEITHRPQLVLERFRKCSALDYEENKYVKSLYRLKNIEKIDNVHVSALEFGLYSSPDFVPLVQEHNSGVSKHIDYSKFQLNHYILKSREEFERKKMRGGGVNTTLELRKARYNDGFFTGRDERISGAKSDLADRWIPEVIKELQRFKLEAERTGMRDYVSEYYSATLGLNVTIEQNGVKKLGFSSNKYWEGRYRAGSNSGVGSYGRLAEFKAEFLNFFIKTNCVESVIDFGCGDGNQLSLLKVGNYTGHDVSETILVRCRDRFRDQIRYRFVNDEMLVDVETADLAISCDVIFHLVEDDIFERYIRNMFSFSKAYVIVYSSDFDLDWPVEHVKHRKFSDFISKRHPEWELAAKVPNIYHYDENDRDNTSFSEFFVYRQAQHHCNILVPAAKV